MHYKITPGAEIVESLGFVFYFCKRITRSQSNVEQYKYFELFFTLFYFAAFRTKTFLNVLS